MNTISAWRLALVSGLALLSAGCANLDAVNKSAGELEAAEVTWDGVAADYQRSCARRNLVSSSPSDCVQEKRATAALAATDKILANYFSALEQASTTSDFSVDDGLTNVATAIDGLPGAKPEQVDAIKGFASSLAGLATRALEERTVKRLITDGAPRAEATLDVLIDTVVPEMDLLYMRERRETRATFASYMNRAEVPFKVEDDSCTNLSIQGLTNGTAFLLAEAYCERIVAIDARRDALQHYKASLQKAKLTLVGLEKGKDDLTAKDLAKLLKSDVSALKSELAAIKTAF